MSSGCEHVWGESEECETALGLMHSPVCRLCGAVKLEVERNARRQHLTIDELMARRPEMARVGARAVEVEP